MILNSVTNLIVCEVVGCGVCFGLDWICSEKCSVLK